MILWIEESYGQVTIQTDPLQQYFHNALFFFAVFCEIKLETFLMNYVFGHHYKWKIIKEPRYVM